MNDRIENRQAEVDVLIAGAGPTGLTLACDLARRGVSVRIIDKSAEHFRGSRGKGLSPRTLEVLEDLGVVDAIRAAGSEYPRLRLHLGWLSLPWRMMKHEEASATVPYPNVWLVPQNETESILRDRLRELGAEVELGTELTGFSQDDNGVTATTSRSGVVEEVRARYLIGADGARSIVRKTLEIGFSGDRLEGPCAIVGDVHVRDLDHHLWHIWPRASGGMVGLCPLPGAEKFQLFIQRANASEEELREATVRELVKAAIGKRAPVLRDPTWLSIYRPNIRLADRYRDRRVLIAGDAAHVHPPTGGQGLNSGIQDAYNLGWKLGAVLRAVAPDALLDTYEEERRPVAAAVLGLSTALFRSRSLRRGAETKQLATHYRGSSLTVGESKGRVRAGDRAPDAIGQNANGSALRLFELFRGPHATLLLFGDATRESASFLEQSASIVKVVRVSSASKMRASELRANEGVLVDTGDSIRRAYGLTADALVLVRPDGYVGLVSDRSSRSGLGKH